MGILVKPKTTLLNIPNSKILVSGIVIILLYVTSFSIWHFKFIENKSINIMLFPMGVFGGVAMLFIGSYIFNSILSLFGMKVAFEKIINIVAYTHFPVLVVTLLAIILFSACSALQANSSFINITNLLIRFVSYYAIILIIYGVSLEHKANRNK